MSKNNVCPSRSVSSTSCNSLLSESDEIIDNGIGDLNIGKVFRPLSSCRTQKAKRIKFFHNGNKFFVGATVPVTAER